MRESWMSLPAWLLPATAAALCPLAVFLGGILGWTAGVASLALLAAPTCLAALTGRRGPAAVTAIIAVCSCVLETSALFGRPVAEPDWSFTAIAAGVLLGLSGAILGVVESLRRELDRLNRQTTDYLRDLYERVRDDAPHSAVELAVARNAPPDESLDYPMLLLSLQDVARRIASCLDLETLAPTIISTAKNLLKSSQCQMYLWNPDTRTLRNATPATVRRDGGWAYLPRTDRGVARWVLENRYVVTRKDIESDYALRGLLEEEPQPPDAVAPLTVGGEMLGLLVLHGAADDGPNFSRLLYILANISALALKNAQLFKRIEDMAHRDGLTGLFNRASFQESLCELVNTAQAADRPLAVVMSDVDHFKKFNDTWGHQAGDHVLRETARLWRAVAPEHAVLCRYGGEEFICLLPDDDLQRAGELAELLRRELEAFPLNFEGQELRVTASFGAAELGRATRTPDDLIRQADEALYRAKKAGRNRVCAASSPSAEPAPPTRPADAAAPPTTVPA